MTSRKRVRSSATHMGDVGYSFRGRSDEIKMDDMQHAVQYVDSRDNDFTNDEHGVMTVRLPKNLRNVRKFTVENMIFAHSFHPISDLFKNNMIWWGVRAAGGGAVYSSMQTYLGDLPSLTTSAALAAVVTRMNDIGVTAFAGDAYSTKAWSGPTTGYSGVGGYIISLSYDAVTNRITFTHQTLNNMVGQELYFQFSPADVSTGNFADTVLGMNLGSDGGDRSVVGKISSDYSPNLLGASYVFLRCDLLLNSQSSASVKGVRQDNIIAKIPISAVNSGSVLVLNKDFFMRHSLDQNLSTFKMYFTTYYGDILHFESSDHISMTLSFYHQD